MSYQIAVYPGSFDPITVGHVDIIERASRCFSQLIIGIGVNSSKPASFTLAERVEMVRICLKHIQNIKVDSFDGLAVDFAAANGADILVRGLRSEADFNTEFPMAMMNRNLKAGLEVVFIPTSEKYSFISSTLVRDVARCGGALDRFVPASIVETVRSRLFKRS
jgi:pantetheine-phosphate adenylyltransferase